MIFFSYRSIFFFSVVRLLLLFLLLLRLVLG